MLLTLLSASAFAAPGWTALLPFGVNLYLRDHPGRGTAYAVTQVAGITGIVLGERAFTQALANEDEQATLRWQFGIGGAAAVTGLSYFISMVDASHLDELERARDAGRSWRPDPVVAAASARLSGRSGEVTVTNGEHDRALPFSFDGLVMHKLWTTPAPPMENLGTP